MDKQGVVVGMPILVAAQRVVLAGVKVVAGVRVRGGRGETQRSCCHLLDFCCWIFPYAVLSWYSAIVRLDILR